jgi:hypothetical protein
MKPMAILKHSISGLVVITLILGLYQVFSLDLNSEQFGPNLISGTYFICLFFVLTIYRIALLEASKIDWIALLLCAAVISLITVMLLNNSNILPLWMPSTAIFTVFASYVFFKKIRGSSGVNLLLKGLIAISAAGLLTALLLRVSSPLFYKMIWFLLLATTLTGLVYTFYRPKK